MLEPLGLDRTMLPNAEEPPALAAGHTDLERDAMREGLAGRPLESVVTAAGAAGGLVSSAQDLTAFARAPSPARCSPWVIASSVPAKGGSAGELSQRRAA